MQINHKLNATEFSAFPIRVPPATAGQELIADQLDAAESLIRELHLQAGVMRRETNELRTAILRKAFEGEL
jgi:hypothetical protein